ncbi:MULTISPECIES: flagellar export chaperone FliS [Microbacterium]|uniref:Flagellar secretion chaperone FliS n=1 Tax=Microbacterium testaceum TaxID=2033 RepID=A0A4Y3QGX3_MICTE|nr:MULTISPECIES: flagellar export chaperone FliS [Microbacterium]MDZ5143375.1 flagellar export chaperone FliS [Microbacterium testaceum]PNW07867.1 flagellar export chaperone FliS [Microbacterium testaceum]REC99463.1 flagellar protein FliS [Microbacterium sp. AG157]WJS91818.1 flagellar export chaperone FliS [Microbacterium testaceum]GEB44471.1 flagellar protein FliS [Microbacterium testaceum]
MPVTTLARAQQEYLEQQVSSATPERLVTMLYDRLLVDVERARVAQQNGDWPSAGTYLTHAQAIIAELSGSLDSGWEGSDGLRGLYTYITGRLIVANVGRDVAATEECGTLIAPLREAWHAAAAALTVS